MAFPINFCVSILAGLKKARIFATLFEKGDAKSQRIP
jgi:hypothetical protein